MLVSFSGRNADSLPSDDAELWLTLATSVAAPQGGPLSDEDKEFARAMEWAEEEDLEFGGRPRRRRRRRRRAGRAVRRDRRGLRPRPLRLAGGHVGAGHRRPWNACLGRRPGQVRHGTSTPTRSSASPGQRRPSDADDDADEDDAAGRGGARSATSVRRRRIRGRRRDDCEYEDDDDDFDELSVEGLFLHVTAMWSVLGAIDSDDRLTPLGWWGLPEAMQPRLDRAAGCRRLRLGSGSPLVALGARTTWRLPSTGFGRAQPRPGVPPRPRPRPSGPDCVAAASSASGLFRCAGRSCWNCLFIERSRKTSATPSAATTRKPSRPGSTLFSAEDCLSCWRRGTSQGHTLPDTREKVIFRQLGIDERPSKMIVLGRPRGALDVARAGEPGAVRVDLGGVRAQRVVADGEVVGRTPPGW